MAVIQITEQKKRSRRNESVEEPPYSLDDYIYGLIENSTKQATLYSDGSSHESIDSLANLELELEHSCRRGVWDVYLAYYINRLTPAEAASDLEMSEIDVDEILDLIRATAFNSLKEQNDTRVSNAK